MQYGLKHDISLAGMVLLVLLLTQRLFQLPFLIIRRGMLMWLGHGFPPFINQLVQTLAYCGTMLVAIFFGAWLFRCGREFLFPLSTPRSDYLYPSIFTGLGVGMVSNLVATVLTILLAFGGIEALPNVPSLNGGIATTLLTFISLTVLPAVLEELLFRGVLLQPLRKYGDRVAIVLSALMFAFCHPTLPQFISAFIMGLCFGVFAVRSGSLVVPILIHLIYNSIAFFATLLSIHLPLAPAAIISWLIILSLLVAGIYASRMLKHSFGSVWWVSPVAGIPVSGGATALAVISSLPFALAMLINAITIFRSLYIY